MRSAKFEELVKIIGPSKAAAVIAVLGGCRININKKQSFTYLEYCKRKPYYDKLKPRLAAELLGCTMRYFKKLKSLSNKILAEDAAKSP